MNDFGLVQLIWIKRLVSETSRINTLIECNRLSKADLKRYKSIISSIDDFCAFVVGSQNWRDIENISKTVDEVEMVLFQHFYEQIDAFEDENVSLDFSYDDGDEIKLKFESPFIEDKSFSVIGDGEYENMGMDDFEVFESSFEGPVIDGEIIDIPDDIWIEIDDGNPFLEIFDMKPEESCMVSIEDLIAMLIQNKDDLSFSLDPEAFPDESEALSGDNEVSLNEFIASLIDSNSNEIKFGIRNDNDF